MFLFLFLFFAQGDTVYATVMPEVDEKEMEKTVNPIVREYFEHGDTKEVQVSGRHLSIRPLRSWKVSLRSVPLQRLPVSILVFAAARCC